MRCPANAALIATRVLRLLTIGLTTAQDLLCFAPYLPLPPSAAKVQLQFLQYHPAIALIEFQVLLIQGRTRVNAALFPRCGRGSGGILRQYSSFPLRVRRK